MDFKDYLEIIQERIDFGTKIEELIEKSMIPISPKMMEDLGFSYEETIASYHMTNAKDLKTLQGMNDKSQISTFTKPSLKLTNLPSKPNVLVKVQGRELIASKTDLYTYLDTTGRRWIKLDIDNQGASSSGKKLKFQIDGIVNKLKKQYKSYSTSMYLKYLKEVQNVLDKGGYKLLNNHLKIEGDYNEIALDKVEVLGAWSFGADKEDIIKQNNIKYLGTMTTKEFLEL